MAITKIPAAGFSDAVNFRNIIINGDMSVAQRGTSKSSLSTGFNTIDRFEILKSNDAVFTESQSTDVPTGQGFANSWKIECTTADTSLDASNYLTWRQPIEAQNLQYLKFGTSSAESITLSFWVKSTKTGTYIVSLRNMDNSRLNAQSYTISSSATWEKKTITFDGDTSSGFNNDNGEGLRVQFSLLAGTDYTSGTLQTTWGTYAHANSAVGQVNFADSTSNELYLTGVQLEVGTSASDFEFLPHDVNLQRCQRYFFSLGGSATYQTYGYGMCFSTTAGMIGVPYPTTMRSAPTVSTETLASFVTKSGSQLGGAPTSLVADFPGINFANVELGGLSSMTNKDALRLYTNNSTATRLEFNAEL